MSWDALGAAGEITGAIAVIATLFFLSKQIRINARELERANEYQSAISVMSNNTLYVQIWQPLMENADLAEIYLKATRGERLNDVEELRYCVYINTFFALAEAAFNQSASGIGFQELTKEKADAVGLLAPYLNKILNTESGNRWFEEEAPSLFTREFLQVVASFR